MHECLWENLHIGTTSYLHLRLFTESQNCSEVREPQGCQDILGEALSRLLVAPSASFGGPCGAQSQAALPYGAKRHSGSLSFWPQPWLFWVSSPEPHVLHCRWHPSLLWVLSPRPQAGSLPRSTSTGALCSPPPAAQ